jgi:hypothetical protein
MKIETVYTSVVFANYEIQYERDGTLSVHKMKRGWLLVYGRRSTGNLEEVRWR